VAQVACPAKLVPERMAVDGHTPIGGPVLARCLVHVRYPSPTVLLIEPHGDTRELYHLWLAQCGFAVTIPARGHDLAAAARGTAADVVVVEPMDLPNGVAFIRALRGDAVCADAVVIVLTTQTSAAMRRHAIEAGADGYLIKPCSMVDLAEAISAASESRIHLVMPGPGRSSSRLDRATRRARAIQERLTHEVRSMA
jgi:DNA-binding response OmpR family regulator